MFHQSFVNCNSTHSTYNAQNQLLLVQTLVLRFAASKTGGEMGNAKYKKKGEVSLEKCAFLLFFWHHQLDFPSS